MAHGGELVLGSLAHPVLQNQGAEVVVHPHRVNGVLNVHAVVDHLADHLGHAGDDAGGAGGAQAHKGLAVLQDQGGAHAGERPLGTGHYVGAFRVHREVKQGVVQQNAGALGHQTGGKGGVHGFGHGHHVALRVHDGVVGGGFRLKGPGVARLVGLAVLWVNGSRQLGGIVLVRNAAHRHIHIGRVAHVFGAVGKAQLKGLAEQVEVLRAFRVHAAHIEVFQNVQDLQNDAAAGGGQIGRIYVITSVGAVHRLAHVNFVVRHVLHGQAAALGLHRVHDFLGNVAGVEGAFALGGNGAQGGRQVRVLDGVARLIGEAVLVQIQLLGGGEADDGAVSVLDVPAGDVRDGEALLGQLNSRGHHVLPAHGAVVVQGIEHTLHLAGHRHGLAADLVFIPGHLAVLVHGPHIQAGRCGGFIPEVQELDLAGFGKAHHHKAAAANA